MTIPQYAPLALLCSNIAFIGAAHAATLLDEDFSYADGNLVPNGGWDIASSTGSPLMVSSGSVGLQHGSGSREDVSILFSEVDSGGLLASFDIVVNDNSTISGTNSEYFAHFSSNSVPGTFTSRIDIVPPSGAGDFSLGISTAGTTADQTFPTDFTFGNTVSIQLRYDFGTASAILAVGAGFIAGNVDGTPVGSLDTFNLRQGNSTNDESITIDNLVVTGTPIPEPSSALLGLLGMIFALVLRRR